MIDKYVVILFSGSYIMFGEIVMDCNFVINYFDLWLE